MDVACGNSVTFLDQNFHGPQGAPTLLFLWSQTFLAEVRLPFHLCLPQDYWRIKGNNPQSDQLSAQHAGRVKC